ncbi:hypothetical protein KKC87_04405 [Patescibacteria group bacterium]|nr:hypothetical protein [Patescibacteria group bacterium]
MIIQIIGCGRLGSQVAMMSIFLIEPDIIYLFDIKDLEGDILDLQQSTKGLELKTQILEGFQHNADAYIITAGKPREKSNSDEYMYDKNIRTVYDLVHRLPNDKPIIIGSNPVLMLHKEMKKCFPQKQIYIAEDYLLKYRDGKDNGQHIMQIKGYTNFAPAVAIVKKLFDIITDSDKTYKDN